MRWQKMGHIEGLLPNISWSASHAQVPTLLLKKDRLRVYFATRPETGITMTTYCDLDINDLSRVLYIHDKPVIGLGEPGSFDEYGIMPSSVIERGNDILLYYSGWSRSVGVPYNNYTGVAISQDGGDSFKKIFRGPVIDRTKFEIFSATSPEVYRDVNGDWHMWYCSGTNWHKINNRFEHTYDIKYAFSQDGLNWDQFNKTVIGQTDEFEAITKPTVIELNGTFHMWYCYRGSRNFRNGEDAYRIGYANSEDMVNWQRNDEQAGIDVSASGWDSEMIGYPAVIKINGAVYMFYNGNSFGKYGFGYAKLEF